MKASEIRAKAKESLKGRYWPAVLAALVTGVLGALITGSIGISFSFDQQVVEAVIKDVPWFITLLLGVFVLISGALGMVRFIIGGVVQLGYAQYLLKQHDKQPHTLKEIFSQFGDDPLSRLL